MNAAFVLKHTIAMLVAGIAAAGLILAATLLSPAAEPPLHAEVPDTEVTSLSTETLVGRWEFLNSTNPSAGIEFTEYGNWFGSDGCNGMGATWSIDGTKVRMQPPGPMTAMGCNNMSLPAGSPLEGSLSEDGTLTITGEMGIPVRLQRVGESISSMTSGDWATSKTSLTKKTADPAGPSITFADDGTWTGSDGCNQMGGTWSWDLLTPSVADGEFGAILHFGDATFSTKMLCYGQPNPKITFAGDYEFSVRGDTLILRQTAAVDPEQNWTLFTLFPSR